MNAQEAGPSLKPGRQELKTSVLSFVPGALGNSSNGREMDLVPGRYRGPKFSPIQRLRSPQERKDFNPRSYWICFLPLDDKTSNQLNDLLFATKNEADCCRMTKALMETLKHLRYHISGKMVQLFRRKATYLGYILQEGKQTQYPSRMERPLHRFQHPFLQI